MSMKVKIPRRKLLAQLPTLIRAQLISCNDLPDYFDFDLEVAGRKHGEPEPKEPGAVAAVGMNKIESQYPEVRKALTPMQWYMFCVMLKHPSGASIYVLGDLLKGDITPNGVSVHIKGLRKNLSKARLPFDIQTNRSSVLGGGSYCLLKK